MNKHIYEKMAVSNILKNGKIYLPYLLTVMGSMMFYFLLTSIGSNPAIFNMETGTGAFKGALTLCGIIQSGAFVSATFIFIFLLYANSFVLKHQKKQLGLYRILGIERRHMIKIIFVEVLFIFGIGLVSGLFLGILFDKLMLVVLFKIIGQPVQEGFSTNFNAVLHTLVLILVIAAIILVYNVLSVIFTKDIDLLKSEKAGEKEPKNRPLYTTLGLIVLAAGYYIALKNSNSGAAINNFIPAAFCVMYATYVLFISGSISLLKLLKKNKKFYYTTKHFISVSGMIYRMKQNAAGLATICVLSTGAIIVLSAGVSLYANGERGINEQFPREIQFYAQTVSGDFVEETIKDTMNEQGFSLEGMVRCSYGTSIFEKTETGIKEMESAQFTGFDNIPDTYILTIDEYNRFNNTDEILNDGEILLYSSNKFYTKDTLSYKDKTYKIKGMADDSCLDYITNYSMSLFSKLLIIVPNEDVFNQFMSASYDSVITWIGFDSSEDIEEIISVANTVNEALIANGLTSEFKIKQIEQDEFYSMYGGILFVGAVLGVLFILSTVMIIYYKQISEGFEDKERFIIMQKVGLSKEEIKGVIHSQIMMVFFIPLITAIVHSAVALKIVAKCLEMVVAVHLPTFVISVAVTCVVFSIVYMVVYKITSKEYYKIVNG